MVLKIRKTISASVDAGIYAFSTAISKQNPCAHEGPSRVSVNILSSHLPTHLSERHLFPLPCIRPAFTITYKIISMAHSQSSALRPRIHPLTHLVAITTRISTRNIKTSITFWPANPATRPPWTTASDRLPRPDLFQVEAPYPDCATTASDRRHTTVPCRTWPATSAIRSLLAVTPTC